MNTDKHRWFEMSTWWKSAAIAAMGLAFGILLIALALLCCFGADDILFFIFAAPSIALDLFLLGLFDTRWLTFSSPLWWAAMFLCAAWPTKKALYGFIVAQCMHFSVVILIVIGCDYWATLASFWENNPTQFFISLTSIAIYLAGHAFLIWLRLRANCAQKNKIT